VGIDNAGRKGRAREYLPFPDEFLDPPEPNPKGALYPVFLKNDVIPFIESHYRAGRSSSDRYLGGSSYGALITQFTAIESPGLFSGLLLESPSFYVNNNRILKMTETMDESPGRVYLGVGTNELALDDCPDHPGNQEAVDGVNQMADIMRSKGLKEPETLYINIAECAEHRESAWNRRLPAALQFLFKE
jgi:predicted alpha/beta superfamily hydrolase